jgi:hypothetical protein
MYHNYRSAMQLALASSDELVQRLYKGEAGVRSPVMRGLPETALAFHPSHTHLDHHFQHIFTADGCKWAVSDPEQPHDAAAALLPLDGSSGYGTFWLEFYLDGYLSCVSCIDILPSRLASVYCFYLPALRHMEWGKYSALLEHYIVQRLSLVSPLLQHWDANFYVHNCGQMTYKDSYQPAELQCPYTGVWVPFDARARAMLDAERLPVLGALLLDDSDQPPSQEAVDQALMASSMRAVDDDDAIEQQMDDVCFDNGVPRNLPARGSIRNAATTAKEARAAQAALAVPDRNARMSSIDMQLQNSIPWVRLEALGITPEVVQSLVPAFNGSLRAALQEIAAMLGDDSWIPPQAHSSLESEDDLDGVVDVESAVAATAEPEAVTDEQEAACASAHVAALKLPNSPPPHQFLRYKDITQTGKDMIRSELKSYMCALGPQSPFRLLIDPIGLFHFYRLREKKKQDAKAAADAAAQVNTNAASCTQVASCDAGGTSSSGEEGTTAAVPSAAADS